MTSQKLWSFPNFSRVASNSTLFSYPALYQKYIYLIMYFCPVPSAYQCLLVYWYTNFNIHVDICEAKTKDDNHYAHCKTKTISLNVLQAPSDIYLQLEILTSHCHNFKYIHYFVSLIYILILINNYYANLDQQFLTFVKHLLNI